MSVRDGREIVEDEAIRAGTWISGSCSSLANTLYTPSSKLIRVWYLSYNPSLETEASFRIGESGVPILRNYIKVPYSIIAKKFTPRCIQGLIGEALYLDLTVAVPTIWNALIEEVYL